MADDNKLRVARTGNEAMAEAMRQINPDTVAAYPITPATEIVQIFAQYVADGLVDTEYVPVESEHSAMSATIGAAAAGARAMTGTSSQGLALMWEMLYIAAGLRLPIVMAVVNRALSAPINIHCDHSDTMGARDSGWIQIYSENSQEAYDFMHQAVRIAEQAMLPVMVTTDGFIISHAMEAIDILPDAHVKEFIGEYKAKYSLLDTDHPITVGPLDFTDFYFEHKRQEIQAMTDSLAIIKEVFKEFNAKFNKKYDLFECYKLDDADAAIVVIGSTAGTAKAIVDNLRQENKKVGLLKLNVFRPFPYTEILEALRKVKRIAVMDRADAMNAKGGPLFMEIRSALYEAKERPFICNYVYGLGGRDIDYAQINKVYSDLLSNGANIINYLGVRE